MAGTTGGCSGVHLGLGVRRGQRLAYRLGVEARHPEGRTEVGDGHELALHVLGQGHADLTPQCPRVVQVVVVVPHVVAVVAEPLHEHGGVHAHPHGRAAEHYLVPEGELVPQRHHLRSTAHNHPAEHTPAQHSGKGCMSVAQRSMRFWHGGSSSGARNGQPTDSTNQLILGRHPPHCACCAWRRLQREHGWGPARTERGRARERKGRGRRPEVERQRTVVPGSSL